jgi:hypothetical protein
MHFARWILQLASSHKWQNIVLVCLASMRTDVLRTCVGRHGCAKQRVMMLLNEGRTMCVVLESDVVTRSNSDKTQWTDIKSLRSFENNRTVICAIGRTAGTANGSLVISIRLASFLVDTRQAQVNFKLDRNRQQRLNMTNNITRAQIIGRRAVS